MADIITRLKVESSEYDSKIARARSGILRMEEAHRKAGNSLEVLTKDELSFVRSLGQMETVSNTAKGRVAELTKAFTDLKAQYNRLTDAEKQSPFGKTLSQSLDQLKGRINAGNQELKNIQGELGNTGGGLDSLAEKFGLNVGSMTKFAGVAGAVATAMNVAKDAILATEGGIDEWGRTCQSAQSAYDVFLQTINGGNWSHFFRNLNDAIGGARELYDALDRLGSVKSNNQAAIAIKEQALAQSRLQLQEAKTKKDEARITELNKIIQQQTNELTALKNQSVVAGKNAGNKQVIESIKNSIRGNNTTGVNIDDASIEKATRLIMTGGQNVFDAYARNAKILRDKGTVTSTRFQSTSSGSSEAYKTQTFDLNRLTKEEQKRYLIAQAITAKETEIQKGISTYAAAVNEGSANAKETFKYNRWTGAGSGGGSSSHRNTSTTKTEAYVPIEGSIDAQYAKVSELTKLWKAAGDEATRTEIKMQLDDAQASLDKMLGKVKEVKQKIEEPINYGSADYFKKKLAEVSKVASSSVIGSSEWKTANAQTADYGTLQESMKVAATLVLPSDIQAQLDAMLANAGLQIDAGIDIPDDQWQAIQDNINAMLAELDIQPIDLKLNLQGSATVTKDAKETQKALQGASSALGSMASGFNAFAQQSKEAAAAANALSIASAIAQLVGQFTAIPKGAEIWSWIAGTTAGVATLVTTIAQIKQATAGSYAEGGVIGGNSYVGDKLYARVNSGETILNQQQAQTALDMMDSKQTSGQSSQPYVSGEMLYLGLSNWGRRTGRGELVFSRG